jgi:hypothetical protein
MRALRTLCLIVLAGLALAILPAGITSADAARPGPVFGPRTHPYGHSYARWSGRYMVWLQEIPVSQNPAADPNSPRNCSSHGNVVFMGVSGTGDGCTVPRGKAIAFTFAGFECSTAEGQGKTFRRLRVCAARHFHKVYGGDRIIVSIDGKRLVHPRRWTFVTPPRFATLPKNNIWGARGGRTKTISKGLFYMLRPPAAGNHMIRAVVVTGPNKADVWRYPYTVG